MPRNSKIAGDEMGKYYLTFPSPSWPPASASLSLILFARSFSSPSPDMSQSHHTRTVYVWMFLADAFNQLHFLVHSQP